MKKIYLFATALGFGSMAFGQVHGNLPALNAEAFPGKTTEKVSNIPFYNFGKAQGDVIFSEDFDGDMGLFTVAAGTMDTIWKFDLDGPDGQFSSTTTPDIIASTTAANGFMIFDADASNPGASTTFVDRIGSLTSPAIDMTLTPNAVISFENRYRTCCAFAFFLKVQVSTDDFVTSQTYNVNNINSSTNDDIGTFLTKVNVSDFLATASNLANFKFRFFFDGAEGGSTSHYFWQVDDVTVYESWTDDNKLVETFMEAGTLGIPYYQMTLNQISPIMFGGAILNNGAAASAGTTLTTTITNGATGSVASTPYTSAIGALDTVFTAPWTPTATTPVTIDLSSEVTATNTDSDATDNIITDQMYITTSVYGVDNGINSGTFTNIQGNTGAPISLGNIMEIINDDYITDISITLGSSTANIGQVINGLIYKYDAGVDDYLYFAQTDEITIDGTNNNTTVTIPMAGGVPVQVFAGDDLLVMQQNQAGVQVRTAQRMPTGTVAGINAGSTYSLTSPRAVRVTLNMNPSVSLDEVENTISISNISPNPTTNNAVLNFNTIVNQEVSIQVVDVTGKVMQTEALGNVTAGGHTVNINSADFKAGVYFVNIVSNDGVATKKLIKK